MEYFIHKKYASCYTINELIDLATAYNIYFSNNNNTTEIPITSNKKHLLKHLCYQFKNTCPDQIQWLKNNFTNELTGGGINLPKGPYEKYKWLNTTDIKETLHVLEQYYNDFKSFGAVPIDFSDLKSLSISHVNFDLLVNSGKHKIGVVFNLDEHTEKGSHWVSLYADLIKGTIYFFDSYGHPPENRIKDFIELIKTYLISKDIKPIYEFNNERHQFGGSECGVYSVIFIVRLLKGQDFDQISKHIVKDDVINECREILFSGTEHISQGENKCKIILKGDIV